MVEIKIIGVGSAGSNAVNKMIMSGLQDVGISYIVTDTDKSKLGKSNAEKKIQLEAGLGFNLETGHDAAMKSRDAILEAIGSNTDMVFIVAGMGGDTGSGAAPSIAKIAKDLVSLTVGIVTKPFSFEGEAKQARAERSIEELCQHVDSLITIPNDALIPLMPESTSLRDMFVKADEVLYNTVRSISDMITKVGFIGIDFLDIKTALKDSGHTKVGFGSGTGKYRAKYAMKKACSSPFLEGVSLYDASVFIINFTAAENFTFSEIVDAKSIFDEMMDDEKNRWLWFGIYVDENLDDEMRVTVIAAGIKPKHNPIPH